MVYNLAAIQANGAVILRSDVKQDRGANAREILEAIQSKYPTAQHCLSFRTFDGDPVLQFKIADRPGIATPICGQQHTFAAA